VASYLVSTSSGQKDGKRFAVIDRDAKDEKGRILRVSWHATLRGAQEAIRRLKIAASVEPQDLEPGIVLLQRVPDGIKVTLSNKTAFTIQKETRVHHQGDLVGKLEANERLYPDYRTKAARLAWNASEHVRFCEIEEQKAATRPLPAPAVNDSCVACEGSGVSSNGSKCSPCGGTGQKISQKTSSTPIASKTDTGNTTDGSTKQAAASRPSQTVTPAVSETVSRSSTMPAVATKSKKNAKKAAAKKVETAKDENALRDGQVRILKALNGGKAMTGVQLAKAANVDASSVGNLAGYRNAEINRRPVHAKNLLNRKFVTLTDDEEAGHVYEITASGKKALSEEKG
jgi:hypothetical protein